MTLDDLEQPLCLNFHFVECKLYVFGDVEISENRRILVFNDIRFERMLRGFPGAVACGNESGQWSLISR